MLPIFLPSDEIYVFDGHPRIHGGVVPAAPFAIGELPIPQSLDDAGAADFNEMVGVRNAIETALVGSTALNYSPPELLPVYLSQGFNPKRIFVARVDGRIVGRAIIEWSLAQGTTSSWVIAEVLPEFRGRGIGGALFETVESLSLEAGRATLQSEILHTATVGGERLPSPTGFGDLPMSDPGVRFLLARGYALEQTARVSFLGLPVDDVALERLLARATRAAGDDYSLVCWTGSTPGDRIEDLIVLRTRMSTDAPSAGLAVDEELWDAARIKQYDESTEGSGRIRLTVAAEHRATGRLVAFTELSVPEDRTRAVQQLDTLVLAEHRGHQLGMLTKVANLRALNAIVPAPQLIYTCNAEENRHMLDVNEAVGFRGVGHTGGWRKRD